jgi:hypothetical protein
MAALMAVGLSVASASGSARVAGAGMVVVPGAAEW